MKLLDALQTLQWKKNTVGENLRAFLACGFTPLHLQTFFGAQLQLLHPDRKVEIKSGLYGDLVGNLERVESMMVDGCAIVIEWFDFDPRLGFRNLGSWNPTDLPDILTTTRYQMDRVLMALKRASAKVRLAICLPTLPLPPVSFTSGKQASAFDLRLQECLGGFAVRVEELSNVVVVNPKRLDQLSPVKDRLDAKSDLHSGFPYKMAHASAVAELLADLIHPKLPKKGLITDLDNTLWHGILGEIGPASISWDLDNKSQIHGLYQRLLYALAESGVLIAVASKNDPRVVDDAFKRKDMILPGDCVFPKEIHWGRKSESVNRILQTWNIGMDSVVFIDDSPMDLAEVKSVYPEIECILFPADDAQSAYNLLEQLRDLFGKESISDEDPIRMKSLRRGSVFGSDKEAFNGSPDAFLQKMEAKIEFRFTTASVDRRAYELVQKTNQFNLNGRRYTHAEWQANIERHDAFVMLVEYQDKFGPLGKISVMSGQFKGRALVIDTWVMSCRAFCRRIEHQCLRMLFNKYNAAEIRFDFQVTSRNGPLQEFFVELTGGPAESRLTISKETFEKNCPQLFHEVKLVEDDALAIAFS